jgi:hypothetical protein
MDKTMKSEVILRKQNERKHLYEKLHRFDNAMRKMDQHIPLLKDYNQKNPKDKQLIPCDKIHKLMV